MFFGILVALSVIGSLVSTALNEHPLGRVQSVCVLSIGRSDAQRIDVGPGECTCCHQAHSKVGRSVLVRQRSCTARRLQPASKRATTRDGSLDLSKRKRSRPISSSAGRSHENMSNRRGGASTRRV